MSNRFEAAGKSAAEQTNQELSSELASCVGLDVERLNKLFPTPASKEELKQLIDVVKSATNDNERVAAFKQRAEACAKAAITLVKGYMKIL